MSIEFGADDIDLSMEDILGINLNDDKDIVDQSQKVVASPSNKKEPPVILENDFPEETKKEEVKKDLKEQAEDAIALVTRLETWNKSCRDLFLDLRTVTFTATEEKMFLECQDKNYFNKPLYFKTDPQKPRDPKILNAQKQFCKYIGIPHSFFMNNRPQLKMDIVKTWQAGLGADDKKGHCIARIRESDDCCVIRALVPETYALVQNHDLIKIVNDSIINNEREKPNILEFAKGDERDDLLLHVRYLFGNNFKVCDKDMCIGFSIVASELGASSLIVEALIHMIESRTSFIASYGSESFFKSKYIGIQPQQVKDIFPQLIERINQELPEMINRLESLNKEVDSDDECLYVSSMKGLPLKFKRALFHEVSSCAEDMSTKLDFARHISLIAKDFDFMKRLSIERAAGEYLNLMFNKQ